LVRLARPGMLSGDYTRHVFNQFAYTAQRPILKVLYPTTPCDPETATPI
jgi:hypothetical protein